MLNKIKKTSGILVILLILILTAYDQQPASRGSVSAAPAQTNFSSVKTKEQIARGEAVYRANCVVCHGVNAQGAFNWKKAGPDGKYPAPPLNGTGHAWHHPTKVLHQVIKYGSPAGQGNMPPWKDKLTDQEIDDVIVWFQSKWSPQIYQAWLERDRSTGF